MDFDIATLMALTILTIHTGIMSLTMHVKGKDGAGWGFTSFCLLIYVWVYTL